MAQFPIARLILMFVRQISKPISKIITKRAKSSRIIRKYVALPPAHMYLWVEKQINIRVYGQAPEKSPVYVEKKAIMLGAKLLGEIFLFTVAASFLTMEYYKAKRKKIVKEYAKGMDDSQLKQQIQEQTILAEQQEAEIRELRRNVYRLELMAFKGGGRRM